MTRRRWLALVVVVALGACTSDDADVSDAARSELQPRVVEIRELADARQAEHVQTKLTELRVVVDDLQQRGELTRQGAEDVRAAAASIESQLQLITTTTTQPPRERDDDDDDDDDKKRKDDD